MRATSLILCTVLALATPAEGAFRSSSPMMGDGVPRTGPAGPQGPQGEAGPAGAVGAPGERGPRGNTGAKGDTGAQGERGEKGDKGDVGASGAAGTQGPKGDVGAAGATGPAGPAGPAGAPGGIGPAGPAGPTGTQGQAGAPGPAGKSLTLLCNATVSEAIVVALSAGIRVRDGVPCPGVLTTDLLLVIPTAGAASLNGYAVHHAFPTAANTLRVVLAVPALAAFATYSIPVAVYAVNR